MGSIEAGCARKQGGEVWAVGQKVQEWIHKAEGSQGQDDYAGNET